jgi:hypothetical protein
MNKAEYQEIVLQAIKDHPQLMRQLERERANGGEEATPEWLAAGQADFAVETEALIFRQQMANKAFLPNATPLQRETMARRMAVEGAIDEATDLDVYLVQPKEREPE